MAYVMQRIYSSSGTMNAGELPRSSPSRTWRRSWTKGVASCGI